MVVLRFLLAGRRGTMEVTMQNEVPRETRSDVSEFFYHWS